MYSVFLLRKIQDPFVRAWIGVWRKYHTQKNCNIISEFYSIHMQFNRKRDNLLAHNTILFIQTNTRLFIRMQYRIWRLPDVLYILLLVCRFFFFIHTSYSTFIFHTIRYECTHLRKMRANTAQTQRRIMSRNTHLNWICLCHFIYYTHYVHCT